MAVQIEQINTRIVKSKDMNSHFISFASQCLKSPQFGVPPLSTSASSSSMEASLPLAAVSSSLSSSIDSLPVAGSSSFSPMFTTAKTSTSDLAEQELYLVTFCSGTYPGGLQEQLTMIIILSNYEDHMKNFMIAVY
ncbi:hypothetical protein QOT17_002209 [Balamuthia mandrillaris]